MGGEDLVARVKSLYGSGRFADAVVAAAADDVEWWAAGDPDVLPWAGAWQGKEALAARFRVLFDRVQYEEWTHLEFLVAGDTVVEIARARARGKATGRPIRTDVARLWTFRDGDIVRVRTSYDTAAYVAALYPREG